ncbi:EAL domain-containing protein [Hydrogenophilus thermoluteolus]|uniref:EAL domain-containing protein n=1 Tax=Hydrogenophilus thermoluteolus TaxID=297 RepID=UPI003F66E4B4
MARTRRRLNYHDRPNTNTPTDAHHNVAENPMNAIHYTSHIRNDDTSDWRLTLDDILSRRALVAHFQPIWRARDLTCYGWEALIRGPQDSPLARPDALFSAARAAQRIAELDYACREAAIAAYAHQIANGAPHKLFLNVEPLAFIQGAQKGWTRHLLTAHGMAPSQVVIEITEASPHLDYDTLRQAVTHYRRQGFEIAIDDLGEGYASLRVWSEIRPDYVKLDRHFVHQAVTDGAVRRFLEAVVMLSQTTGSRIVAEGVEKAAEWHLVQQLGFDFVQGFLFAPPQKRWLIRYPRRNGGNGSKQGTRRCSRKRTPGTWLRSHSQSRQQRSKRTTKRSMPVSPPIRI